MDVKTAYHLLGLKNGCGVSAVQSAFRSKSLEAHPDKGGSTEEFSRLSEARELLLTVESNDCAENTTNIFGLLSTRLDKILSSMRRELNKSKDPDSSKDGDVYVAFQLTLAEAYRGLPVTTSIDVEGVTTPVTFSRDVRGTEKFSECGRMSSSGKRGDLYVETSIRKESPFTVIGRELHLRKKVNLATFLLGGELDIALPDRTVKRVKLQPHIIEPIVHVPDAGMPYGETSRGSLVIRTELDLRVEPHLYEDSSFGDGLRAYFPEKNISD
jgi:DnaJ-class molecular chaperone